MHALRRSIPLGLLLALVACDEGAGSDATAAETGETSGETSGETGDPAALGVSPASVAWVLDWSADELELVSDLGYVIHVEAGWIGTWGVTLVECANADAVPLAVTTTASAPSTRVTEPSADTIAWPGLIAEGHTTGQDDPSAWVYAGVESLTERGPVPAEPRPMAGGRYCQAHYLIAPIADTNVGFAEHEAALAEIDPAQTLAGATFLLFGTWAPPGGGEPTPFVLRSEQAYGKILALELDADPATLDDTQVEVEVERALAGLFTGVEFATMTPEDAAWKALGNLVSQARVVAR